MKTTFQKIMGLLLIAVTLISCSKKDTCDPDDKESPCYAGVQPGEKLLLTEEKTNGKTELKFEYNERNQVVVRQVYGVDGSITSENLTYNGDKLIKIERRTDGALVMTEEYTYGNGNKPTSAVLKDNKGAVLGHVTITYSGKTVTETSVDKEGKLLLTATYTFNDKGNLLTWQMIGAGNSYTTTQTTGDYDDKPHRYTNYPWAWKLSSVNNARSYTLTVVGPGAGAPLNHRWEYVYNEAGYPSKAEVYDKTSGTLIETRLYTYKKASLLAD